MGELVNFVRVLMGLVVSLEPRRREGGERQRSRVCSVLGCSVKAHCTGKSSYLEPNRDTMQKPIGGVGPQRFRWDYIKEL